MFLPDFIHKNKGTEQDVQAAVTHDTNSTEERSFYGITINEAESGVSAFDR